MNSENEEYLVRGALLYCNQGSHPRRLNLPECHGVYVMEHPVIQETDCKAGDNISYFGICNSSTPPENSEEILLDAYVSEGQTSTGQEVQGLRCCPDVVGNWRNCYQPTKLKGEKSAVTTSSYLICNCGGIIQPLTSGQEYEQKGDK